MIVSILRTLLLLAAAGAIGYVVVSLFRGVPMAELATVLLIGLTCILVAVLLATAFRLWPLIVLIGLCWGGRMIIGWLRMPE
ncbi:MAG: hypothetical protein NT025_05035 [bacterium]|nr:hypothetical protein [bacterium]